MKTVKTYYLSSATGEYTKKRGTYPDEVFEVGTTFNSKVEESVEGLFLSLDEARKALKKEKTFISDNGRFLFIEEYAIVERFFNLEDIIDDEIGITDEASFFEALKKDPNGFYDYEIYEMSECIYDYSVREFTVEIETDIRRYEQTFNDYSTAREWMEQEVERLDSEGAYSWRIAF